MTSSNKLNNPLVIVLLVAAAFFLVFMLIMSLLFWGSSRSSSSSSSSSFFSSGKVGLVELEGPIMESKKVLKHLKEFEENQNVKAVVLRLNSPGGSVAPSQEIYEYVKAMEKPVVASMGSVAASGAFYVAMGADKVMANPGTITGSIGVIMQFANMKRLFQWARVEPQVVKTGKYKDTGSPNRALRPDERRLLQGLVDNVLEQFRKAIVEGRKLDTKVVAKLADGRIFSGEQAFGHKLVDALGTFDDAVMEAAKMAGIEGKPETVKPRKTRKEMWDAVLDGFPEEESRLSGLLKWFAQASTPAPWKVTTPGVYWIWQGAL